MHTFDAKSHAEWTKILNIPSPRNVYIKEHQTTYHDLHFLTSKGIHRKIF